MADREQQILQILAAAIPTSALSASQGWIPAKVIRALVGGRKTAIGQTLTSLRDRGIVEGRRHGHGGYQWRLKPHG